ncbi:Cullin repeat-like-containing domain protein [Mycena epipterygia]|nr:Cullin repeat-like-containing domain protein [Mycena epipterygia]
MAQWQLDWETKFEPGLTRMLTPTGTGNPSYSHYVDMFTLVYNLATQPGGCQELYKHIANYFAEFTNKIREDAPAGGLVEYYDAKWDGFSGGVVYVDRACTYLNRHWVNAERKNGNTNIDTVLNVALRTWKENVLERLASQLRDELPNQPATVDEVLAAFVSGLLTGDNFKKMRLRPAAVAGI